MKKALPFIASSILLAATLLAAWWYQASQIIAFIPKTDDFKFYQQAHVEDQIIKPLQKYLSKTHSTLIHFWNPSCVCNRISQRHFVGINQEFDQQDLKILVVAHSSASAMQIEQLKKLNNRIEVVQDNKIHVPSSPSLVIADQNHKLSYFGPYGFGAFCTMNDERLLPSIIEKSNQQQATSFINVVGDGCFCQW